MSTARVVYPRLPVPAYVPPSPAAAAALAALLSGGPWLTPHGREVVAEDVERVYALVCRRQRWTGSGVTIRAVAALRDAGLIVRPRPPARPGAWVPAVDPVPVPRRPVVRVRMPRVDPAERGPDPACVRPADPAKVARFWHRSGADAGGIAAELDRACPRDGRAWTADEAAALLGGLAAIDVRKRLPAGRKLS
jgi:hypothetical protein